MNVMLIDTDPATVATLQAMFLQDGRIQTVTSCQNPEHAWQLYRKVKPDAVFIGLDIMMPEHPDPLKLAARIRRADTHIRIVCLAASRDRAYDAFGFYPLDYLIRPVNRSRLRQTIERLLATTIPSPSSGPTIRSRISEQLSIRCFGDFSISTGSYGQTPVRLPSRKCRELLAFLLSRPDRLVSRDTLLDQLFDGHNDPKTINQLHVAVYQLRSAVRSLPGIRITDQYRIEVDEGVCDLVDFWRFVREDIAFTQADIRQAEKIAARYGGSCFAEEDYPWAETLRADMEQAHERLMLRIAAFYGSQRQTELSEQALRSLVRVNPFSDAGHSALLDHYLDRGEPKKFRQAFESYEKILSEELDAPMEPRYRQAYHQQLPS